MEIKDKKGYDNVIADHLSRVEKNETEKGGGRINRELPR